MKRLLTAVGLAWFGMVLAIRVEADAPRKAAAEGVRQYQKECYDRALTEFISGLELAPDRKELRYDYGTALYKLGQFPQAAESFSKAASGKSELDGDAWYNLGNSLFKAGKPQDAVTAYKGALKQNHGDQDAKHNLELALRAMQMQQQQQQCQGDSSCQKQQQQPQPKPDQQDQQKQQQQQQAMADSSARQDSLKQVQPKEQQTKMTREEAMQLLQAMESDEQEAQKEKLEREFGEPKRTGKDW